MKHSIAADERAAMQFDDLASALDAGLPLHTLGGDAADGDRTLHGVLARRGIVLSPTEATVLLHAWRAGRAGDALRARARARQRRADFARTVWAALRYPLVLLGMVPLVAVATMAIVGPGLLIGVVVAYAVLAAVVLLVWRGARSGAPWVQRLPLVGPMLGDFAELPYVETLHALYGAGVPLRDAHHTATATVTHGAVAGRVRIADAAVQAGRPLGDGLTEALALHPETRSLIVIGEQSGQLEDALRRALERRQTVAARSLARFARIVGQVAYACAVVAVVVIVYRFYSGYFAMLRR